MFAFVMFVLCNFVGWALWYRDYRRRMLALRRKHFPNAKFRYEPSGVFPWRFAGESAETRWGIRMAANRLARRYEKLEVMRENGEI